MNMFRLIGASVLLYGVRVLRDMARTVLDLNGGAVQDTFLGDALMLMTLILMAGCGIFGLILLINFIRKLCSNPELIF